MTVPAKDVGQEEPCNVTITSALQMQCHAKVAGTPVPATLAWHCIYMDYMDYLYAFVFIYGYR